jgi:type I restriction enzyme R subunit
VSIKKVLETVAKGVVDPDLSSTLAARLIRLEQGLDDTQREKLKELAGGMDIPTLAKDIVTALNPDQQKNRLVENGVITEADDPSEEQLDKAERELLKTALKPFLDPKLRDGILLAKSICDQVIDELTPDELLSAGYDAAALEKAQSLVQNFRQFIDDNKDELEAIRVFYSQPYRAGLSFKAVKELAEAIKAPPLSANPDKLWAAYQAVEPHSVKGKCGKLVDLIAILRHAIDPSQPLVPYGESVEQRYAAWLAEQETAGVTFTAEQLQWLNAIKDHIASSLTIEPEDFDYAPFMQLGGLGKVHDLFGDNLQTILAELNARLAA